MNDSLIEWTSKTWNPITGCPRPKVSPGCAHCYAERVMNTRLRHLPRYQGDDEPFQALTFHDDRLFQPLRRKKPTRIFVCSMGDLFHELADDEWIAEIFTVMALCPQHTFLLLTKRPERLRDFITGEENDGGLMLSEAMDRICPKAGISRDGISIPWPLPNVWLGVTVCNQAEAAAKLPVLLQTPAAKRFVSVEPMLGAINLRMAYPEDYMHCTLCGWHGYSDELVRKTVGIYEEEYCPDCQNDGTFALDYPHEDSELALGGLDWVICDGETGPGARPMHPDWVRSLRDQCKASRSQPIPFFFKSWGEWLPRSACPDGFDDGAYPWTGVAMRPQTPDSEVTFRVGKRRSGHLLDGVEWNEVPA